MAIDKKFVDLFLNVTSKAALASHFFVGKKDKIAADKAAVDSMRIELNHLNMKGNGSTFRILEFRRPLF